MELITAGPQYPDAKIRLVGEDGNAFSIMARVTKALKAKGHSNAADEFSKSAMAAESYGALLRLVMDTVTVEDDYPEDFDDDEDGW